MGSGNCNMRSDEGPGSCKQFCLEEMLQGLKIDVFYNFVVVGLGLGKSEYQG